MATLRRAGGAALAGLLLSLPVHAGPWIDAGDARIRFDIELLRSNGIVVGPTNSWPLPLAQVDAALQRADGLALPPGLAASVRRLQAVSEYNHQRNRFRVEAAFTNDPALVRGFQDSARGIAEVSVSAQHDLSRFTVGWGMEYTVDGDDPPSYYAEGNGFRFMPLFVAMRMGNWALWAGEVDRYWGPSNEGGLLVSTSSRSYPQIGLRTLEPKRIELPVLKWLGPVNFEISGGVDTEKRSDYDNPGLIHIQLDFAPLPGITVGLNRAIMLCGKGRPCSAKIIGQALIGFGNFDNTGTTEEPGNQIAGWNFAYNFRLGTNGQGGKLFFETAAEDEDDFIIQQYARRGGGWLFGPLGQSGSTYAVGIEYVSTLASELMGSQKWPGSMYNNFIYTAGYTRQKRPIGYSLDGDTNTFTFAAQVTDPRNRLWYGSARDINLNMSNTPSYRISQNNERIVLGTAGVEWPTRIGDLAFELRYMTDQPNTPGTKDPQMQVEFGWRTQF